MSKPERFEPGGIDEAASQAYERTVADPPPAEDEGERARRLRRRRRILMIGGVPALAATAVAVWLASVWVLSFTANRAAMNKDYETALSRYETVEAINPWIDQWRVHYNVGTVALLAGKHSQAQERLEAALEVVPRGDMVEVQASDGTTRTVRDPQSPECRVRTNLYAAYYADYAEATAAGDTQRAAGLDSRMTEAIGDCPIDPPSQSSTAPPSQSHSPTPSQSPTASATPSASQEPSGSPTPSESQSASASPTPSPEASASASPSPSPSPGNSKRDRLKDRNASANPSDDAEGLRDGRRW